MLITNKVTTSFSVTPFKSISYTLHALPTEDSRIMIDYRDTKQRYDDIGQVVVFPGGSHRFDHLQESEKLIRQTYNSIYL